jgi:transcriptional regulator with XRE-family HTH domain
MNRHHESIGARIRRLRKEMELTQVEFSGIIGCRKNNIGLIETNRSIPGLMLAIEIAKACEVSIDYLCCLSDDPEIRA